MTTVLIVIICLVVVGLIVWFAWTSGETGDDPIDTSAIYTPSARTQLDAIEAVQREHDLYPNADGRLNVTYEESSPPAMQPAVLVEPPKAKKAPRLKLPTLKLPRIRKRKAKQAKKP
jgi:FtsZ-interacting cell division protein ZipA